MSRSWRLAAVLFGMVILSAGCDKSGTTASAGPGKGGADTYGKKLVGTWEGTEDFGGKTETFSIDFMADNSVKAKMGPFDLAGTWKVTKEDGKKVSIEWEIAPVDFPVGKKEGADKKAFNIVFQDDNTIVMAKADGKPDEKTLKRKS